MSRRARERAYRPGPVHLNSVERAISGARKLPPSDVATVKDGMTRALLCFGRGEDCHQHWMHMADALNVAESLAIGGICSDEGSLTKILAGQAALAAVLSRQRAGGSWTLYGAERQALDDALWLHGVQLDHASFSEYEAAVNRTIHRIQQAKAGNAGRGVVVVDGARA